MPQHSTRLVFAPIVVYVILYAPRIRSVPTHSGGTQALGCKLYDHWSIWKGQDMNVLVIEWEPWMTNTFVSVGKIKRRYHFCTLGCLIMFLERTCKYLFALWFCIVFEQPWWACRSNGVELIPTCMSRLGGGGQRGDGGRWRGRRFTVATDVRDGLQGGDIVATGSGRPHRAGIWSRQGPCAYCHGGAAWLEECEMKCMSKLA
jgi:hypothetical protein